jgi:hypothetical protein
MNPKPLGRSANPGLPSANHRIKLWYGALIILLAVFIGRLFYLQIIRHDHYRQAALSDQLKQYSIQQLLVIPQKPPVRRIYLAQPARPTGFLVLTPVI